jgi:tRNA threonylcarbamoyladenosine biosynthesis protein TsaB
MLILAVDTSTRTGSAAILRDSEVLAQVSAYEETPYSTRLFRDIALLQELAKLRLDQIDVFAVASGPGSFTGLRVGLTAVKAWSEVHKKPISAVSGLEAIASESLLGEPGGTLNATLIAPFLDARRGQLFGAIYRRVGGDSMSLALASDESILSVDEFIELLMAQPPETLQLVSPTPEVLPIQRLKEALPDSEILQVTAALAPAIGRLGFERAKSGALVDALRLDANYIRRSDAESAWKDG